MGIGFGVNWRFEECEFLNVAGGMDTIPAGIHPVAERDTVTVYVGTRTYVMDKATFNLLKAQRKVNHLL